MTDQGKKKYKKNFLTNVICRLDFRAETDQSLFKEFRAAVKKEFPIVEEQKIKGFRTHIEAGEAAETSAMPDKSIFRYKDVDEQNFITLTDNYLGIDSLNYISFKKFGTIINFAIDNLLKLLPNPDFTRLGLRSINQIVLSKGNPFAWKGFLEPSFNAVIEKFFNNDENLARMMTQVVLNYDDYKVNFNYGMHNSEFPAKISRKEFVLDFDFYTEYFENDDIMPLLKKFNKESAILFEKCIKDNLRKNMGVINE